MLQKLIRVLGINETKFMTDEKLDLKKIDPDESYVLTLDNLMKMLAIHLKFRYCFTIIIDDYSYYTPSHATTISSPF